MTEINKMLEGMWGKGTTHLLLLRFQTSLATIESVWEILIKTKNKSTIWPIRYTIPWHMPKGLDIYFRDKCLDKFLLFYLQYLENGNSLNFLQMTNRY